MSENEDKYHDIVLDLEATAKKNEDVVLKIGNSLQGMFMLGPKPMSFYDSNVKHGLGYENPYTLKKSISQNPKLYDASCFADSKIHVNIRDTEDILDDATNNIKEMKDVFDSTENELSATRKQNELLNDQLLEVKIKHEIECCMLLSHECVNNNVQDEIKKIQRDSIEIQEGMQKRINILENDMEKLDNENVSLNFQVQSLIKERENVKLEYQKLFNSIKKTRTQTQGEVNELIEHVNQKTYAYADVRVEDQDLLMTITELKTKLKNVKKGKSMNTKFDKTNVSNQLIYVTPLNKQVFQKKTVAPKIEEKHVLSKTVTLQTSPNKKKDAETNKNVIAPGMYKVKISKKQETNTHKSKIVLSSTGLKAASSVRRPSNRDSPFKDSVLSNTKNASNKVKVSVRTNKKTYVASKNVVSNKKIVTDVDVKNALKAKDVLCVSCTKNVLIPCHEKCLAKYKLNVHSKVRRALVTTPRTAKSIFEDTTPLVLKTRVSVTPTQSKSLDTTPVVSKTKIDVVTTLSAKNKVVQIVLWIVDNGCSKHMTGDRSMLKIFIEKFMGTIRFGNDHFAAITGYDDYVQGNITVCHVYYVEGLGHNLFSVGQFCDGDLEVAFRSNTCYVHNLEGDDLLTGARESNLLSHLNFGTINDLTKHDMVDGLPKFKYSKDHLCSACERGKGKKSSHPPKLVPSTHFKLDLLHMDLCGPMRVATINGKKYILVIVDDYSRFTWAHYEKLGIMQQFSNAQTPQQNGVVERRNRTLVEAARTMLIFLRLPEFLWAEAIFTACFTQNRSIIHTRYNKTPYELLYGRKPNVEYFHLFGSLCYPTNDREDLGKMKPKADIGIFI
ncbi:retrovirus-related pol polyprotein from transposon TNT 1-94 [Tanacetum coccineum]